MKRENQSLFIAIEKNDIATVTNLIQAKYDINTPDYDGTTALHIATYYKQLEILELLLQNGANVNAKKYCATTGLHIATNQKNYELVFLLLKYGADCNSRNTNGDTPLHIAARNECIEIASLLLSYKANCRIKNSWGETAFYDAVRGEDSNMIALLIQYDKQFLQDNITDVFGNTILHCVVQHSKIKSLNLLLKENVNINCINTIEYSPLELAITNKKFAIAKILIEAGADINLLDSRGKNSWSYIAPPDVFIYFEMCKLFYNKTGESICILPESIDKLNAIDLNIIPGYQLIEAKIELAKEMTKHSSYIRSIDIDTTIKLRIELVNQQLLIDLYAYACLQINKTANFQHFIQHLKQDQQLQKPEIKRHSNKNNFYIFLCGTHIRLGSESPIQMLPMDILEMIASYYTPHIRNRFTLEVVKYVNALASAK